MNMSNTQRREEKQPQLHIMCMYHEIYFHVNTSDHQLPVVNMNKSYMWYSNWDSMV